MDTNISNFDRNKPTKTYKLIKDSQKFFEEFKRQNEPVLEDYSAGVVDSCNKILSRLKKIEQAFLAGE